MQRAASERASHDRRLNLQRTAAEEGKAIEAQIRQLIETSRQSRVDADVAYHFTVGTAIKKLLVSRRMHEQINHGSLAIVRLDEDYEVVPGAVAEKIARRDQDRVIVRNTARGCDEDDEYADYKVPDDLMW